MATESNGSDPNNNDDDDNHPDEQQHQDVLSPPQEERSLTLLLQEAPTKSNMPQLVCAFLASLITGGTSYAFGLYGDALKKSLHLSQPQLDTVSTANFCAGLLSWIPGLIVDRFGVRVGLISGGMLGSICLCLYWGVATQVWEVERWMLVPTLCSLGILIFFSSALVTGSVFKIIVATCGPGSKGSAVGVAKGYVGLGAGVFATIFEALKSNTESDLDFLPMAAFFFVLCAALPGLCLMPSHSTAQTTTFADESTPLHFRTLYCSLVALAALIIGQSILELVQKEDAQDTKSGRNIPLALFLVTLWMGPIYGLLLLPKKSSPPAPQPADLQEAEGESLLEEDASNAAANPQPSDASSEISLQRLNSSGATTNDNQIIGGKKHEFTRVPGSEEEKNQEDILDNELSLDANEEVEQSVDETTDKNLCQMLQTPTAMLMLWTCTIIAGAGVMETANMGQMVEALHFPKETTSAALAFFSVAQSGSRVITGAVSESALNWNTHRFCIDNGIPRPFFLAIASTLGFCAHLLLAVATTKEAFVIGSTLAGFSFGMVWPLMVLVVGEVFGMANYGANYMFFDGFTIAGGSLLLSKFVAQEVYEDHIDRKDDPDNVTCLGSDCFAMTHTVCAVLSATCIITSLCMMKTTRHIYNRENLHAA